MRGMLRLPFKFALAGSVLVASCRGLRTGKLPVMELTAKMNSLLAEVSKLPTPTQRAIGCCVGSCVMDAAARPMHWCYDQTVIEEALSGGQDSAFYPTSISPYYTIPTGENSCYYDLGFVMLNALPASADAPLDLEAFHRELQSFFGPGTPYNEAFKARNYLYDPEKRYDKREPVPGPWQQSSVTSYLEKRDSRQSRETDGLVSTLPLIARLSLRGPPSFLQSKEAQQEIRSAAHVLSTNPFALTHTLSAAVLLGAIIRDGADFRAAPASIVPALAHVHDEVCALEGGCLVGKEGAQTEEQYGHALVQAEMESVLEALHADPAGLDHTARVLAWGKPCANPGSFQGALHAFLSSDSFAEGARKVVRAGGCNCSRANLCGALLGAAHGFEEGAGIPREWILKADKGVEVLETALSKFRDAL